MMIITVRTRSYTLMSYRNEVLCRNGVNGVNPRYAPQSHLHLKPPTKNGCFRHHPCQLMGLLHAPWIF